MANEYLKRTNTSAGNRRTFTYAFWIKGIDITASNQSRPIYNFDGGSNLFQFFLEKSTNNNPGYWVLDAGGTQSIDVRWKSTRIDPSSWYHITLLVNTTEISNLFNDRGSPPGRVILYIDGVEIIPDGSQNSNLNSPDSADFPSVDGQFYHGANYINGIAGNSKYQLCDYYFVDGQALTPDVFGFYKDGNGYMSSGSNRDYSDTQTTDFRPGQWMPHSPSKIKKDINRRGGFGVNGFYLPMNDSSNPGADFHCTPNSIIKLKGEDLPQPRNGAPTTSDAFVSQLRPEKEGTLGFDGVVKFSENDYLTLAPSTDFNLGTGDFTIEFWIRPQKRFTSFPNIFVISDSVNASKLYINFRNGANLALTDATTVFAQNGPFNLDNWFHVAVVRTSGQSKIYMNGVGGSSVSCTNNFGGSNDGTVYIGSEQNQNAVNKYNGFISNFRIVKGTALYTADFIPPTEPLTNVANTKLLCCNSVSSPTAATVTPGTITNNGGVVSGKNEIDTCLVLAVPGISTSPNAELVTNGTFDTDVSGWTITVGSAPASSISWVGGSIQVTRGTGSGAGNNVSRSVTVEVGKSYVASVLCRGTVSGTQTPYLYVGTTAGNDNLLTKNRGSDFSGTLSGTFTATATTVYVAVAISNYSTALFDNVSIREVEVPRDYSADIKGSGTNKTLTANGNAGVGYDLGGYYGSAMTFDGTGDDAIFVPASSDSELTGDFTIEYWAYSDGNVTYSAQLSSKNYYYGSNSGNFYLGLIHSGSFGLYSYNGTSSGVDLDYIIPEAARYNQWHHMCFEREGNTLRLYLNGVVVAIDTSWTRSLNDAANGLYIGKLSKTGGSDDYGNFDGKLQDLRIYNGLAKYKGGFDVPKPYTPVGIEAFRTTADTCKNNFATLNPLIGNYTDSNFFASDGNLSLNVLNNSGYRNYPSTFSPENFKGYLELRWSSGTPNGQIGITDVTKQDTNMQYTSAGTFFIGQTGDVRNGSTTVKSGCTPSFSSGDTLQIAFDFTGTNKNIWFGRNGTWGDNTVGTGNPSSGTNPMFTSTELTEDYRFYFGINTGAGTQVVNLNFGQNPSFSRTTTAGTNADDSGKGLFKYAPPSGFLALCADNLPTPAIADPGKHFKSMLYTGSSVSGSEKVRSISGLGFKPDLVWLKSRSIVQNHQLYDSVRGFGGGKGLSPDTTGVEGDIGGYSDTDYGCVSAADDDGFSVLSTHATGTWVNSTGVTYVAWCWKAGGAAVTNNDGTITSQVSVNQTAGFSIVSYTGTATAGTIGHGLGKRPKVVIVKRRDALTHWTTWFDGVSTNTDKVMSLDLTNTEAAFAAAFNSSDTTTTTFPVGTGGGQTNASSSGHIAYCWAEIEGYSKFGSYIGNASTDGPFVYCGFKPAWVMIKVADTTTNGWVIMDNARSSSNPNGETLFANISDTEYTDINNRQVDFLSNGFKLRNGSGSERNTNGATYIFMAFAESPFQTANAK